MTFVKLYLHIFGLRMLYDDKRCLHVCIAEEYNKF